MSIRDSILAADDLKRVQVPAPEWGQEKLYVRTMTASERDAFEAASVANKSDDQAANLRNFRARLAVVCLVNEAGERIFSDSDAEALGGKSAAVLGRIFDAAASLNGFGKSDVDDLVKN